MPAWDEYLSRIEDTLRTHGDPVRARQMADYMRGQFLFVGITSPERRTLVRAALAGMPRPDEPALLAMVDHLWQMPEREFQYVGCDLLARHARLLTPAALPRIERLIVTKSWWDTVDALATQVVGSIAQRSPETRPQMDARRDSDEMWLVRASILHQLKHRDQADAAWLFDACTQHAAHRDFFIRKAIGWALRSYARTDPDAVRAFVAAQGERLSGLSRREALRRLG
jgi:3-methyladenine DNA glycosylase AlkD